MNPALQDVNPALHPSRLFWALATPLLLFRLWLSHALPITGDEAYFIWWGKLPDWGFYDHPPMVGWWAAAQLSLSDAAWWLRLTSTLQPLLLSLVVAWFVPRIWPEANADRRWWGALFVLLAPASVWNVLITTDTPLVYFSVLSGLCWLSARRDGSLAWYFASGLMLAGAVLSKYFAAFLGFAYLVDTLRRPDRRKLTGLALLYACTLPALALMAWWNAGHCWPNYMFNFVNRNSDAGLSWKTPLLYAISLLYLLTPPVILALRSGREGAAGSLRTRALAVLAGVPLVLFGVLSLLKTIGLHWVLSFLPFVFVLVALHAAPARLAQITRFMIGFALVHVIAIVALSLTSLETWRGTHWYDSVVLAVDADKIVGQLEPYAVDYSFASNGYADAVTLGYAARRYFSVFGEASSHARHDDILTDFRALDGRNILILRKSEPRSGEYQPYFREVEIKSFVLHEVRFFAILGRGFDYARYREDVLRPVKQKYYALPRWLPQCGCYFCDRYFRGEACVR